MSDLRTAAQAVIDAYDSRKLTLDMPIAINALRAALALDASIASREIDTSGGCVDSERLDWLLEHPNEVLEDAGNEWFILDADGEPTYFKSGREAIDAARQDAGGEQP